MAFDLSDYIDVATRLREFREQYPTGSLQPFDPERPYDVLTIDGRWFIVCTAAAYRSADDPRPGVGIAYEPVPGKTPYTKDSELQNAQTSAWGRAIVAALAADTRTIASAEEVRNRQAETNVEAAPEDERAWIIEAFAAIETEDERKKHKAAFANTFGLPDTVTSAQLPHIRKWMEKRGLGSRDATPRVPSGGGGGDGARAVDAATQPPCRLCDHSHAAHSLGTCTECSGCPGYEAELPSDESRELFEAPDPEAARAGVAKAREKLGSAT